MSGGWNDNQAMIFSVRSVASCEQERTEIAEVLAQRSRNPKAHK